MKMNCSDSSNGPSFLDKMVHNRDRQPFVINETNKVSTQTKDNFTISSIDNKAYK